MYDVFSHLLFLIIEPFKGVQITWFQIKFIKYRLTLFYYLSYSLHIFQIFYDTN